MIVNPFTSWLVANPRAQGWNESFFPRNERRAPNLRRWIALTKECIVAVNKHSNV